MKRTLLAAALLASLCSSAVAFDETCHGHKARYRAAYHHWHGPFYHAAYGAPMALIIPPTAEYTSDYAWGVCGTSQSRNDTQFQRPYPGPYGYDYGYGSYGFMPTPPWPSNTRQFGVYPVRGPW